MPTLPDALRLGAVHLIVSDLDVAVDGLLVRDPWGMAVSFTAA